MATKHDGADILKVFEEHLEPEEHDRNADLGCDLDYFLGFTVNWSFHNELNKLIHAKSWMREPLNYAHHAEWRLQEAVVSACLWAEDNFGNPFRADRICVRITDREFGSPYHRSIQGFHYIIIPTGYIAAVENYWRTYQALAVVGEKMLQSDESASQKITSNRIGGSFVERCLQSDPAVWTYLLSGIITDTIFWDAYDGPFQYPEEAARVFIKLSYEVINGFHSSNGNNFRLPRTSFSMRLTRIVLLYVVGHEVAHAMFSQEGSIGSTKLETETLCDLIATMHTHTFVNRYAGSWDIEIDGVAEYAVGPFGFFTIVEARYTTAMLMEAMGCHPQNQTQQVDLWNERLLEIQLRNRSQVNFLKSVLSKESLDILNALENMRLEIEAVLIGIKMFKGILTSDRDSSFESVFDSRRDDDSQKTGDKNPGS